MSPIRLFHVCAGALGILFGIATMCFAKGSRNHRVAGQVFVASMLCMSTSGAYIGAANFLSSRQPYQIANFLAGVFTFYLVVTGWMAARRRHREVSLFDWVAAGAGFAIATAYLTCGIQTAAGVQWLQGGLPAASFFAFGSVATLAAAFDARVLRLGGIEGVARTRRHLWRMSTATLIAMVSFFIGQGRLLPHLITSMHLNALPVIATLTYLFVWLFRTRSRNAIMTFE